MARSSWDHQVPFVVREAMAVAQTTAVRAFELAHPEEPGWTREPRQGHVLPVPMTVRATVDREEGGDSAKAECFFHFPMGVDVKVSMVSAIDTFGEHWGVLCVVAKYWLPGSRRNGHKAQKIWAGEELDELARLWGNCPYRWHELPTELPVPAPLAEDHW